MRIFNLGRILAASSALFIAGVTISTCTTAARATQLGLGPHLVGVTAPIPDGDIDRHIDATMPPDDRAVIRKIMLRLAPTQRQNVIYYALNGRIYSNRLELLAYAKDYHRIPGTRNQYLTEHGSVAMQEFGPKPTDFSLGASPILGTPPGNGNSGPFRRVYSRPGYSVSNASVYVPCYNYNIHVGNSGNVYTGGWSNYGAAADAGFELNTFGGYYTAFMLTSSWKASNIRFGCGQNLGMTFFVLDPGDLELAASGYDIYGTYGTATIVSQVPSNEGWTIQGTGCVLKRMTTIAQRSQNFYDGEYYVVNSNLQPLAYWSNATLEYYSNAYQQYILVGWNQTSTGGFQDWPADQSKIRVIYVNQGTEYDGIYL